jgi:HlyD family secretion protein
MKSKLIGLLAGAAMIGLPLAVKFGTSKPALEIESATVQQKEIRPSILASGNFVFRREVQLSSEVIGRVSEVLVKEGDRVEQGQILLRLDPSSYRAEVAQQEASARSAEVAIERAQINLDNQRRNLERDRRLVGERFIGVSKFDETTHQMELAQVDLRVSREGLQQARALLTQARERLGKTEVRAPIGGTVTSAQIKLGETAVPSTTGIAGSSLMTIADTASMMAEVNVDEADIARVAGGQAARVFAAGASDQPIVAKVDEVSMIPKPGAQAQGRSYVVKLRLGESSPGVRAGMTCRVEIVTAGGGEKPVLPLQAIQAAEGAGANATAGRERVFVVADGIVHERSVRVGVADDANQEILGGLAVGETVAIGPARILHDLRDGDRVKIAKAEPKKLAVAAREDR